MLLDNCEKRSDGDTFHCLQDAYVFNVIEVAKKHTKQGFYGKAIDLLKWAIERKEGFYWITRDELLRTELGKTFFRKGDFRLAKQTFEEARGRINYTCGELELFYGMTNCELGIMPLGIYQLRSAYLHPSRMHVKDMGQHKKQILDSMSKYTKQYGRQRAFS